MLPNLLQTTLTAREALFDAKHEVALRLFNGFLEGEPSLAVDLYGRTLLIHDYGEVAGQEEQEENERRITAVSQFYREALPWLSCVILKTRRASATKGDARNGQIIWGSDPATWVREHGVRYALDLLMNQDASLYLDTRHLRRWLIERTHGRDVLNTFAYTGSLGVAACAGGAHTVIQTDLNKQFLNVGKTSYTLNGFPIDKKAFITGDFWPLMNRFKREGRQFDMVILDPPFFSTTSKGRVDLARNTAKLINKVRPLVRHGGQIVAINNALFVSGQAYWEALMAVGADGYVTVSELIAVPADFTGYAHTAVGQPITPPTPFNHTTKIAILQVSHKL